MRLDKFIADNTPLSRREVQIAVKAGRVLMDGEQVKKSDIKITNTNHIVVDGTPVQAQGLVYMMLHKPLGYVSANEDADHPTLLDLIHESYKHQLQIAGRLDKDTTGLVLLTNDGQWNHRITSPKHQHTKTYIVTTTDHILESAIDTFKTGVQLDGKPKKTLPAQLTLLQPNQAELIIQEGKYHQVKRMFAAIGNRVEKLHRAAIGQLDLPNNLAEGEYRLLTAQELELVGRVAWSEK